MKKWLIVFGAAAFMLAGCNEDAGDVQEPVGDSFEDSGGPSSASEEGEDGEGSEGETVDSGEGASLYEENCLSCHGQDMQGESGPGIAGMGEDEVINAIAEGPGSMPENLVEGEDAEAVAAYVAEGGE
ncbi:MULTISPECIES: cytochrome c [unclassified Geomicrobium]|uniref:c-type cytochrome n=1 Tax=unclassified Geomicrobium TaxID=2628951 RepID=UPI00045ED174|nr:MULTISPECIES: cytochrome c [unclassified Geomicrobium]GAK00631.1 cytochrome c551 [Geomicrobium sp. JCM 19055]GAK07939.1 cytochrome c551 [Geomicrobium sp. JCM 19038]